MSSSSSVLATGNSNDREFKSPTTKLASKVRLLRLDEGASSPDDTAPSHDGGARAPKRSRLVRPAVDSDSDSDDPEPSASKRPRESRSPVLSASDGGSDPQAASPASAAGSTGSPERDGIQEALAQFSAILASGSDSDSDVEPAASKPGTGLRRKLSSKPRKGKAAGGAARHKLRLAAADSASGTDNDDSDDGGDRAGEDGEDDDAEDSAAAADEGSGADAGLYTERQAPRRGRRRVRVAQSTAALAPEAVAALAAAASAAEAAGNASLAESKRAVDPLSAGAAAWQVARAAFPKGKAFAVGGRSSAMLELADGAGEGRLCAVRLARPDSRVETTLQLQRDDDGVGWRVTTRTAAPGRRGRTREFDCGVGSAGRRASLRKFSQLFRLRTGADFGELVRGAFEPAPGKMDIVGRLGAPAARAVARKPVAAASRQAAEVARFWERVASAMEPAAIAATFGLDRARTSSSLLKGGARSVAAAAGVLAAIEAQIHRAAAEDSASDDEREAGAATLSSVAPSEELRRLTQQLAEAIPLSRSAAAEQVTSLPQVAHWMRAASALDGASRVWGMVQAARGAAPATHIADAMTAVTGVLLRAADPAASAEDAAVVAWTKPDGDDEVPTVLAVDSAASSLPPMLGRRMAWTAVEPAEVPSALVHGLPLPPAGAPLAACPLGRALSLAVAPDLSALQGGKVLLLCEVAAGSEFAVARPRYFRRPPAGSHSIIAMGDDGLPQTHKWPTLREPGAVACVAGQSLPEHCNPGQWTSASVDSSGRPAAADVATAPTAVAVFDPAQVCVKYVVALPSP